MPGVYGRFVGEDEGITMQLICFRPRTQLLGVDSHNRTLLVMKRANKKHLREIRACHKKMLKAGWPWPGGKYKKFQTQPNDSFFLKIE